jgi:hypothetical protein
MNIFKKLFGKSGVEGPTEPIFPGESFVVLSLNMPEGLAIATFNDAYKNYHNKAYYPFLVGIELETIDKNENGHPTDVEAIRLNDIEDEIIALLKQKHTVHPVVRVTRNGARDIFIYIDTPKLTQEESKLFYDRIQKERNMTFFIKKDVLWEAVSGFIE